MPVRVQKPLSPPLRLPAPDRRSTSAPALLSGSLSARAVSTCRATLTHPVGECVSAAMLARPYCDDPLSHHPGSPSHRPAEIHHSRVSWPVPGHQTRPASALYRDMGCVCHCKTTPGSPTASVCVRYPDAVAWWRPHNASTGRPCVGPVKTDALSVHVHSPHSPPWFSGYKGHR